MTREPEPGSEPEAPSILIVEDDDRLAGLLVEFLAHHHFRLERVSRGDEGAERILCRQPDLVVLDLMLPGLDGLGVCRTVRERYSGAILMLTASQSEADHVAGLDLGADDFVTKPLEPRVLLARIRTLLRRIGRPSAPRPDASEVLVAGPIHIDLAIREARFSGEPIPLTTMELDVLAVLVEEAGRVATRDLLYERVCGTTYDGLDRGMDVHVSRIRRKLLALGCDPRRLRAVRGAGYLLSYR
jgi:DNA-binding response OmpR family regulator